MAFNFLPTSTGAYSSLSCFLQVLSRRFARTKKLYWARLPAEERTRFLSSRIFLSVRDPYTRLWSTFLHTLMLPDLWNSVGVKIEKNRGFDQIVRTPTKSKLCGMDATFAEFVDYILASYEADFDSYHRLCDPCQLKPTYVIKAETLLRDRQKVLEELGLPQVFAGSDPEEALIRHRINVTVMEAFAKRKDPLTERCATHGDVARRLWQNFIVHGDIPE
ncbi:uncharacterized protein LOC106011645, partial [Aplysia californica]|uniref:Carbohydrate sulfotransferase n=1 Tax=Aplysia californica TaxID=6500 RepID=A0ABM0ZZ14_APLCA